MPDPTTIGTIAKIAAPRIAAVAVPWILNRIAGTPRRKAYEQFIEQQQPMLSLLQRQAMGQPSPASRFIESRLQQAAQRSKQAAAASATRGGLGVQARRAVQQRIGQQTQQAMADVLARLQMGAQAQYGQLMGQIGLMRAGMFEAEAAAQQQAFENIGAAIEDIRREYNKQKKDTGVSDTFVEDVLDKFTEFTGWAREYGASREIPLGYAPEPRPVLPNYIRQPTRAVVTPRVTSKLQQPIVPMR